MGFDVWLFGIGTSGWIGEGYSKRWMLVFGRYIIYWSHDVGVNLQTDWQLHVGISANVMIHTRALMAIYRV